MINRIDPYNIPKDLFNQTYTEFEFEVLKVAANDERPMSLRLVAKGGPTYIIDNLLVDDEDKSKQLFENIRSLLVGSSIKFDVKIMWDLCFVIRHYNVGVDNDIYNDVITFTEKQEESTDD